MAYCMADRQFKSLCARMLATLRWTNTSPGNNPINSFAGTRESAQPIHMYSGFCCFAKSEKNVGSLARVFCAHARLFSNKWAREVSVVWGIFVVSIGCEKEYFWLLRALNGFEQFICYSSNQCDVLTSVYLLGVLVFFISAMIVMDNIDEIKSGIPTKNKVHI